MNVWELDHEPDKAVGGVLMTCPLSLSNIVSVVSMVVFTGCVTVPKPASRTTDDATLYKLSLIHI